MEISHLGTFKPLQTEKDHNNFTTVALKILKFGK
jgi:hypothetical protein